MIIATFTSCGQSPAKVTSPALFSKVTKYEKNYETGEFYKKEVTEYEYENAYPVSIKSFDYDENGIASKTSAVFNTIGGSGDQDKYDLTIRDGRVVEAVQSRWEKGDEDGECEWVEVVRYEFEYTDTEITAERYAEMINYVIMEGGTTYYIYNWY